jgi:Tol biopolymer transport system component
MTLSPGDRLGPYEITSQIGEGGMGLVFRAKDSQLGREVALKVLPEGFSADPERLARFEREAKLLASLNHPNIAQIYGLETSGGSPALVMELVEGPTLADRLAQGSLSIDESLSIARQIAEALEEAHEKGIVHRDLKPQNVKASMEGKVKVLDFGLAKAVDPAAAASGSAGAGDGRDPLRSPALMNSPTLTLGGGTQLGVILGTAAYMAPEQAAGGAADARADIWAFGAVLYEMLTGKRLFEGETVSHVLAGVLKDQPDWKSLPADVPPPVRALLERCLRKDRRQRLQAIGDARVLLEEWSADPSRLAPPSPAAAAAPTTPRRRGLAIGLGALALAAGLAAGRFLLAPAPPAPRTLNLALALPADTELASGDLVAVAVSADGSRQAAVVVDTKDIRRLLVRDLDQVEPRLLPGTEGALDPCFSPDGDWIAFFLPGGLYKMAIAGGPAIRLADAGNQTRGVTWSRDGYLYFSPDLATPVLRVSENGGAAAPVTTLDSARNERTHRWPAALPDGSAVLFTDDTGESTEFYDDARIEAVRPSTGERRVVLEGSSQARYLGDGRLIFARGGALFAIAFDPRTLAVSGAPVPVAQQLATDVASGAVQFAFSETGDALWAPGSAETAQVRPVWMERGGRSVPVNFPAGPYGQIVLSPDGRKVALAAADARSADIWVADLERSTVSRLTFEGSAQDPVWTADGSRIVYDVAGGGAGGPRGSIRWKRADGSGESEVLFADDASNYAVSASRDGRFLAFERTEAGQSQNDIWILPLTGERKPWPFLATSADETRPEISPDGRWLAYVSSENGRPEIFVRPFPRGDGRWQISNQGGTEPHWSADGRELYYRSLGTLNAVAIEGGEAFTAGLPVPLFEGVRQGSNPHSFSPAPDGKRMLLLQAQSNTDSIRQLDLRLDWIREVRRLMAPRR